MKNKSSWLLFCSVCMCLLMCGWNVQAEKNGEKEVRASLFRTMAENTVSR